MTKTTRTITATIAALALTIGGASIGYTVGTANTNTVIATTTKAAQCDAIEGLKLTPKVPYELDIPEYVWGYQVSVDYLLTHPEQGICG